MNIKIDNVEIDKVSKTKFLGKNENLAWEDHIASVKTKVSNNIGVIWNIRNCLPRIALKLLQYTLIHPYFNYCNIVWVCQDNIYTQRIYRLKKSNSSGNLSPWNSHSVPILKRMNILNIFYINIVRVCERFATFVIHRLLY